MVDPQEQQVLLVDQDLLGACWQKVELHLQSTSHATLETTVRIEALRLEIRHLWEAAVGVSHQVNIAMSFPLLVDNHESTHYGERVSKVTLKCAFLTSTF